ncbi:hypothetical protein C439_16863 [Haloferax mediterranei ATCC 33500]|uniref:VLIG-type G domain-containing protein n=1 Tax=Haloferax mediterranei (strain ATCC 33500 / DSM 1411 / JCM 8866 / NBRC 14739 / NCIMB 2177 / R-4) TaxID=523841 RepID=M0INJ4_HALMT|nr:hypothetical protein C439_16863 [Haloferax mediterranei ATCC 33500]
MAEPEESHKEGVQDKKNTVENILDHRESIYNDMISELNKEIREQKSTLDSAARSPDKEKEARVRERLKELYREHCEELRSYWRDRESWMEMKMELEEELA